MLGKAKTGSGKTLAFGIPMLERTAPAGPGSPPVSCSCPTRELAGQVTDVSNRSAVVRPAVGAVYGGATSTARSPR